MPTVVLGDTFLTRKVVRPRVDTLPNMTGQAMWNKFVNTSNDKHTGPTEKEHMAATALDLEERLDFLNADFVNLSTDIFNKEVIRRICNVFTPSMHWCTHKYLFVKH